MKCPHCGHSDRLHRDYWGVTESACAHESVNEPDCECPGWLPERNKPVRTVNVRGRGGPTHGGGWVSPLDESVVWPDDAA